jgi:dienelactone hydrolase
MKINDLFPVAAALVGLCLSAACGMAAPGDLNVLTNEPGKALEQLLMRDFQVALDRRLAAFEQIKSRADCRKWQDERREFFIRQMNGFPDRTPLNARIVGRLQGEGYRVENVLFESRPGHHVTGNLYLPKSKGPYPGVLIPCGHSHTGKPAGGYQRMGILLAKNGMAALCYDPIGQGERYQSLDFERTHETFASVSYRLEVPHPRVRFLCTVEHTMMGIGSILLGSNVAQFRIWDGMRAIDYLQNRPDIIDDRIGCVGNSGGGTLTAYLMALDDRIVAAAPTCYLTTFRRLIESKGAQDGEQNIFGQIDFGMDEADYLIMRAPKPTLINAATRDATFPIEGAWELFREAKRFYSRLGFPERVEIYEGDLRHGMYLPQREAAARWMHRWLLGGDKVIQEVDPASLPDPVTDSQWRELGAGDFTKEQLYCAPEGQVMLMEGERSVFEINAAIERGGRDARAAAWNALEPDGRRELVRRTIGARAPASIPAGRVERRGIIPGAGYRIEKIVLHGSTNQLSLPGLLFAPENTTGAPVLYLHGKSMKTEAGPGGEIERYLKAGHAVLAAELSGIGETETGHHKRDYGRGRFGRDVREIYLAYLLGRSYIGMRSDDVRRWTNFLQRERSSEVVHLHAVGEAAIPALYAAALRSDGFETIRLESMIRSWADLVAAPVSQNQLVNVAHGALRRYDLPDLVGLVGRGRIHMEKLVDATGQPLSNQ